MEYWRQCAMWLIGCKVLPENHRVTAATAQVFDLAQTLRDGVLLCQLLNNLRARTINLKEINLRPQMSQFLCLKNIRLFLTSCCEVFGLKKSDLFDAFDLFDVRDFGKVTHTNPQTHTESLKDEDVYNNLQDLIEYKQAEVDVRSCCLTEIKQTEEKYTETLESIEKYFMNPLKRFFTASEMYNVFVNIPDLVKVHKSLMVEVRDSILNKNALNLYQIFISYKERLLIYGIYCSRVEIAIAVLDLICKEKEDVRLKLEECSKRANNGKFTLRDLLVVPMQRVLKYHLLLQELVKHTHDAADKSNLKIALDAMKDLAQYVNEVKRDNETLREIDQYQRSIENLNQPLMVFGRPKGDGEVRMISSFDKRKQDRLFFFNGFNAVFCRHIFLFDVAVIVCKRRGDNYEMKEILDLNYFKITNNPTSDREMKKWCYGFYVTHQQGHSGFELFFKTRELKKKWLDQFEMAISNIRPEKSNHNSHQFKMHTFERITSCSFCHLLLRGIFNQGYLCLKCGLGAHKECLGRLGVCGRTVLQHNRSSDRMKRRRLVRGLPRMVVIRDYSGIPCPPHGPPLSIHAGDVIELMFADLHSSWWQGKILATGKIGFFPSDAVRPCPLFVHEWFRFAGPMERYQAEVELLDRGNSTYLVRHRSKECTEYAISIKFNDKVKHIKILTKDGGFYIAETRLFKTVLDLVEYYKQHSLKEGFSSLDTTLQVPYRELSNGNMPKAITKVGSVVGNAVARYNFCSRDTQELSLLQGDVIKIYTKMPNGWWKGEIDGRVGWFPSTYVEEEED
uniref:Guanine nucleotide exchange factor VAV3-like n=1 Tax=Salarias fasciatus TaxID=181472 RepID=A0A672JRA9_SALFA